MTKWLCAALLAAMPLFAQDETSAPLRPLPMGDVLLNLPSNQIAPHGQWEVKFTHRFNQSLVQGSFSDQLHSLFGLDANADVVFGVSYAIRPNLQLSAVRSNTNDTIEAAAKYVVLRQTEGRPFNLTVRGGADVRTEKELEDRTSVFAQAIVSRQFGRKAEVFLLPTFATNAGRAVNGDVSGALFEHAFNVPVAFAWMLRPGFGAVAEIIPPNQDLPDGMDGGLGWAVGVKRNIGGHWFEILLTNNQSSLVDQYVTSTYQGSALDSGDIKLGFNIERRFGKRK
ncbi:MAG TPA: DUF5777 family beta-barrel protein [Thermoanaerobaculia bacterium]|jgi:hypothetical protein|nr:DUF5777 family beta-barrel protein [Thermoanaerobaculia bacterium]